jgi:hypothetical protein
VGGAGAAGRGWPCAARAAADGSPRRRPRACRRHKAAARSLCLPECSASKSETPSRSSTIASPSITKCFCRSFSAASTIMLKQDRTHRGSTWRQSELRQIAHCCVIPIKNEPAILRFACRGLPSERGAAPADQAHAVLLADDHHPLADRRAPIEALPNRVRSRQRSRSEGRRRALSGNHAAQQFHLSPGHSIPSSAGPSGMPTSGKKERNAACHVRLNLRTQLFELLAEQRAQHQGEEDHILEAPPRR